MQIKHTMKIIYIQIPGNSYASGNVFYGTSSYKGQAKTRRAIITPVQWDCDGVLNLQLAIVRHSKEGLKTKQLLKEVAYKRMFQSVSGRIGALYLL